MTRRQYILILAVGWTIFAVAVFFARVKYDSLTADAEKLPIVMVEKPKSEIAVPVSYDLENRTENSASNSPSDRAENPSINNRFASAAAQNSALANSLSWTFGGKTQAGWYLYKPLICRLVGVETDASGNDFAAAVARWQQSVGLPASGVLDNASLAVMVTLWQLRRPKNLAPAAPLQLLAAPTKDFWDASRAEELRRVERETYAAYRRMITAAAADKSLNLKADRNGELAPEERFLKIVSAHRSREYQNQLRAASPNSGRAGLAVNSPHFSGRALDIYVGGEPVSTQDANRAVQVAAPVYLWLVKNAEQFGFRPYFYEPWHWEYVGNAINR